jgi:hypothetical protein
MKKHRNHIAAVMAAGLMLCFMFGGSGAARLYGQDEAVKTDDSVPSNGDARKESEARPATAKAPVKEKKNTPVREVAAGETAPLDALLHVNEGNYKYRRIPGIKLSEPKEEKSVVKAPVSDDRKDAGVADAPSKNEKGLFGMSRKATDIFARSVLIGVILLIIVLYRFRTRSHRSNVLKRFPKA